MIEQDEERLSVVAHKLFERTRVEIVRI